MDTHINQAHVVEPSESPALEPIEKWSDDMRKAMQKGGFGMPGNLLNTDPQPITEVTHSCTLEFPNGDIVEIPGPEGEGWESEVVFDEWTVRDPDEWGHFAQEINRFSMQIVRRDPGELADDTWNTFCHKPAMILIKEYENLIFYTEPRVLSLTKHTRTYTPAVETKERYTEFDKFPLLNGVK